MLANVKIEQDKENPEIHRVFVDGKKIEKITHLDFEVNPLEIPSVKLNIEQISGVDFEGQAEVNFLNTPFTVQNACKILRDELLKHGDLYNAFVASINSVLMDGIQCEPPNLMEQKAKQIMDRIIGDEQTCT